MMVKNEKSHFSKILGYVKYQNLKLEVIHETELFLLVRKPGKTIPFFVEKKLVEKIS